MQRFFALVVCVLLVGASSALVGCSSSRQQASGYRDPLAGEPLQRMREAAVAEVNRREAEARLAGHPPLTPEQRELAITAVAGEMEANARGRIADRTAFQAVRDSQVGATDVPDAWRRARRVNNSLGVNKLTAP
jgi:hypothetical protein